MLAHISGKIRRHHIKVLPYDKVLVELSVERLDYAKAPVQKAEAVAELLARCPELRGRLRFRLVCPPPESGITAYDTTRQALKRRIAEIIHAIRTTPGFLASQLTAPAGTPPANSSSVRS